MRTTGDADAEAWVLTSDGGARLLEDVGAATTPGPADLARWRRTASAERVSAALRIASCRARGSAKFSRADRMWLEPVGLEQATAEPVAWHKAGRFVGGLVVDLCAGVGGDSLALGCGSRVLAVDVDRGMCRRIRWNADVYGVAERVAAIQARAETFPLPHAALVHVDPDRRARGTSRARGLHDYVPGLDALRSLARRAAGGAIKLGPASDFADHFASPEYEVELTSLAGECKEATIWFGSLATCRRRATVLPGVATWTDRDGPEHPRVPLGPIATWAYDPDPSLLRAGLLESFSAVHGLRRYAPGVDFLTASECVDSPFLAAFEVVDVLPLDLKALKREVARRELGTLEIKTRGVRIRPEEIRAWLRPRGPHSATLLLSGGSGPSHAVLARRHGRGQAPERNEPLREGRGS